MNWTRNHSANKDPAHYKEWRGGRGKYRITWRDQVEGVSLPPEYHACMLVRVAERKAIIWEHVPTKLKRPQYRTLKAAKATCEKHADPTYKPPRKKRRKK